MLLEGFKEAVHESGPSDLGYIGSGNEFTWKKSERYLTWVQKRLDRGLANLRMEKNLSSSYCQTHRGIDI